MRSVLSHRPNKFLFDHYYYCFTIGSQINLIVLMNYKSVSLLNEVAKYAFTIHLDLEQRNFKTN